MSNSIWHKPDQKPDVYKPYTFMVVYEAHDEAELMLSTQYEAYTADRYINRWCYLDDMLALEGELERTRKALDVATGFIKGISQTVINDCDNQYVVLGNFKKLAQGTIEQITALEQKDNK